MRATTLGFHGALVNGFRFGSKASRYGGQNKKFKQQGRVQMAKRSRQYINICMRLIHCLWLSKSGIDRAVHSCGCEFSTKRFTVRTTEWCSSRSNLIDGASFRRFPRNDHYIFHFPHRLYAMSDQMMRGDPSWRTDN